MHIIAHRGMWDRPEEQNTLEAFARAFSAGFGIETDVRDCAGRLVISHNPPSGSEPDFEACLDIPGSRDMPIAINVKSDGLAGALHGLCSRKRLSRRFVFDMSVPDMRQQLAAGNPVYARMSEVEKTPPWQNELAGIWLDGFAGLWYGANILAALLEHFGVCVVSQELHGRDHSAQWAMLRPYAAYENLMLCTDLPGQAQEYFQ